MKCFYHHDRDAVATCKSCGKGVCMECLVDLGMGVACKNRCESDARAVIDLTRKTIESAPITFDALKSHRRNFLAAAWFLLIIGIVFIILGIADARVRPIAIFGAVCGAFGVLLLIRAMRIPPLPSRSEEAERVV